MKIVISKERKKAVDKLMATKGYRKHHHGIKFTRFYFNGELRFKVNDRGDIKSIYNGIVKLMTLPSNIAV